MTVVRVGAIEEEYATAEGLITAVIMLIVVVFPFSEMSKQCELKTSSLSSSPL